MIKVSEFLKEAREIIADPSRWTKGAFARSSSGRVVDANYEDAKSFCAWGACKRVDYRHSNIPYKERVLLMRQIGKLLDKHAAKNLNISYVNIINFNDCQSHEKVLEVYDAAIKEAEATEANPV